MQPVRGRFPSPSSDQLVRLRKNLYLNRFDPLYHEKVIRYLDPHSPEAHFRLAQHYEQKEMRKKAILHYQQAMHTYPSDYYYQASASIRRLIKQEEEHHFADASAAEEETAAREERVLPLFLKVLLLTLLLVNVVLLLLFFTPPSLTKVVTFLKPWPVVGKSVTYESAEHPFMLTIPHGKSNQDVEHALHEKTLSLAKAYPNSLIMLYGVASSADYPELQAVPLPDEAWRSKAFVIAEYNPAVDRAVKIRFLQPDLPQLKSRNQASANLVRTALVAYTASNGHAPATVAELLQAYPHNYLSFLPEEARSGSDDVRTFFDGSGGWVYDRNAASAEAMFYPNTTLTEGGQELAGPQTAAELPFEPVKLWVNRTEHLVELRSGKLSIARYPVGLGAGDSTPSGSFHVNARVLSPSSRTPGVYGSAALGLEEIALHGTADDASIGANRSLGCIRLNNADMTALFKLVPLGTEVVIGDAGTGGSGEPLPSKAAGGGEAAGRTGLLIPQLAHASYEEARERADGVLFYWLG
ncbi:L,D-transpeptidase catalytic domain [Paenibacillus sp. UNCCL117]|uniref:L,D-transpeptidase family protein n=1 Tax=unclassified Paenibacillus TaxID=185978 RepID=UPI00089181FB|nr:MULTISPECIES: L,D-transpeptidase [unclassified Paenibacillus]SDC01618.1 L,D-transpeptidase catalytic domain [Paenibacillus sp. cl123]SFW36670.1 L,D-transpeptidase catalytic domain [Paenibacillus sp. UNCCL117]